MFGSFQEAQEYLYKSLPVFQQVGAAAYNPDLGKTLRLLASIGNPHQGLRCIHVAGTNGKGSSSHMLAAVLQTAGYKTGLFTSPHLKSVRERIRVNGDEISEQEFTDVVNRLLPAFLIEAPSFFEATVAMAFAHFRNAGVEIAVLETGLGGRLDATNVVDPEACLITNIGHDHMDILGDTLQAVAGEKAGIIKPGRPVVISEYQQEVSSVFRSVADERKAPIYFADELVTVEAKSSGFRIKNNDIDMEVQPELKAAYQRHNIAGVVAMIMTLKKQGYTIADAAIRDGLTIVNRLTGLRGRWQQISSKPLVMCDTGHNPEGIAAVIEQIGRTPHRKLWWVFGMVGDKPPEPVLRLLPKGCFYFFCQAKIPRAMDVLKLFEAASAEGLSGKVVADVNEAIGQARLAAAPEDLIMVGGSTYVVAEVTDI